MTVKFKEDYKDFLTEKYIAGKTASQQKEEAVKYFLHYGDDHIRAAQNLINTGDPSFFQSAGVLYHVGIELILKALVLWEHEGYNRKQFGNGHDLSLIVKQFPYLEEKFTIQEWDDLKILNDLFELRYPVKRPNKAMPEVIGETLRDFEELASFEIGEVGDVLLKAADRFYHKLLDIMPEEVHKTYLAIDPCSKGGAILMEKKIGL